MPIINQELIDRTLEIINSPERKKLREEDKQRFEIYNGHLAPALVQAIKKEFKKPETVEDLIFRLVPLNIVRKIINKLAGLYIEAPVRKPQDGNEADQMLIDDFDSALRLNLRQKEANRYFKLFKRNLQEILIDNNGIPLLRNLPRHQYEVFSYSMITPNIPDLIVKILNESLEKEKSRYIFWTGEQHILVNGKGEILLREMAEMNNLEGVNPYGKLPFVYTNESSLYVDPIPNDDLLRMGILIPLLLTDLAFASKYQTWSIIYVMGFDGELPASPNSVISLPYGPDGQKPEIGTVKPEFSMVESLEFVHQLTYTLLSTNNLSTSGFSGQLNANNPASGISKALDESQSTEDKRDQQEYFLKAEDDFWNLLSKTMIPYWRKTNQLNPKLNREFSSNFNIYVELKEPEIALSEKDKLLNARERLKAEPLPLSTHKQELANLYQDLDNEQIEQLQNEIIEEQMKIKESQISFLEETAKDEMNGMESSVQD